MTRKDRGEAAPTDKTALPGEEMPGGPESSSEGSVAEAAAEGIAVQDAEKKKSKAPVPGGKPAEFRLLLSGALSFSGRGIKAKRGETVFVSSAADRDALLASGVFSEVE